jgi:hypothetical protein
VAAKVLKMLRALLIVICSECANPLSKKNILYKRVAYKKILDPVSLDNNFFDTQNLKILSCVNPWTFKTNSLKKLLIMNEKFYNCVKK